MESSPDGQRIATAGEGHPPAMPLGWLRDTDRAAGQLPQAFTPRRLYHTSRATTEGATSRAQVRPSAARNAAIVRRSPSAPSTTGA